MADNGWGSLRLGDICTKIGSGATPRGGKEVYLRDGPCALIRSQNVHNDQFHFDGLAFIDIQQATDLDNVEVFADDVLLNITGDSVARACQVAPDVLPARVNQHVAIIRPDPDKLLPRYLRYFLVSPETQVMLLSWAGSGGTRNALTKGMIESFDVRAPMDIAEQRAIAHILGTLDDKIELNRRMNETLEAMARGLFKDWFVDFGPTRAKAESRDPYLAPEIWDLFPDKLDEDGKPEGWEFGCLADIADSPSRGVRPSEVSEDTPYIGLEHMPRHSVALTEWGEAGTVTSNKNVFKRGEFLFGKLRPYFHKVGVAPIDGICSTDIVVIAPRSPHWSALTLACISTDDFVNYTNTTSTGTKMPRTSWKTMGQYELCFSTVQVAQAFEGSIGLLTTRIVSNIHECKALSQSRDLLLPKLMSGEIRAGDTDEIVLEST